MMNNILVTGGAGFLGSHLCEQLLKNNSNSTIVCLDNLYAGQLENIGSLFEYENFYFFHFDVTRSLLLPSPPFSKEKHEKRFSKYAKEKQIIKDVENFHAILNGKLHQIYHLACAASPIYYQYKSIETMKTGVLGTMNVLDLADKYHSRFLLTSTSEIYGEPLQHPQRETYFGNVNSIGVRSCYDEGKRAAESTTFDYYRQNNTEIRVARLFNSYGPKMSENDGRVVSNFIVQSLKGESITIYGSGDQTRSFCYCEDTIDGIIKLMNQNHVIGPVNIGMPKESTIKELAEAIISMINPELKITYHPLPSDDPSRRQPDIQRAIQFLNWEPKVELKVGLQLTIDYFREQFANGSILSREKKFLKKFNHVKLREEKEVLIRNQFNLTNPIHYNNDNNKDNNDNNNDNNDNIDNDNDDNDDSKLKKRKRGDNYENNEADLK